MSPYKQMQVISYCRGLVGSMFADFHDDNMKGSNFTWENFPNMMASLASANVSCVIRTNKNTKKDIETFATNTAKDFATILLKNAKYI